MEQASFDPSAVTTAFDAFGDDEWTRHDSPLNLGTFHTHNRFLDRYVHPGHSVLEVGAGPGRFTIELARLGARIVIADISPRQLQLNRRHVAQEGLESSIVGRTLANVLSLPFPDGCFDEVVCYGTLSFLVSRAADALAELVRVTTHGGTLLLSVASRFGTVRALLRGVREEIASDGIDWADVLIASGELPAAHTELGLPMHLFTWTELESLIERKGCEVLAASSANFLSTADADIVTSFADDPSLRERFLEWELEASGQPGAVDGGTQILAALRRAD